METAYLFLLFLLGFKALEILVCFGFCGNEIEIFYVIWLWWHLIEVCHLQYNYLPCSSETRELERRNSFPKIGKLLFKQAHWCLMLRWMKCSNNSFCKLSQKWERGLFHLYWVGNLNFCPGTSLLNKSHLRFKFVFL